MNPTRLARRSLIMLFAASLSLAIPVSAQKAAPPMTLAVIADPSK